MTDSDPVLRRALDAYRVPDAPHDLDDAVIARLANPPRMPASRRRLVAIGAILAAAAALAIVISRPDRTESSSGRHVATARETLRLGQRAIVVVEGGAELRWQVSEAGARVVQEAGSVFYRVEPGAPFSVETPSGTVEVLGTCFRVEVEPMKVQRQTIIASGIAAAVAITTVVAVYEGGVRVVNARGDVTLAAGETARIDSGAKPARGGSTTSIPTIGARDSNAPDDVVAQNETLREQLAISHSKITRLEQQLAESGAGRVSHVDPTPEQLAQWAARCEIHLDSPSVFRATPPKIDPKDATEWGLTKVELPIVERVMSELHERARDEMRDIYLAATGNTTVADEVTAGAMLSEIFDKALPADAVRARQRIARERAGLDKPPTNLIALPPIERALRLIQQLGADFEKLLGESMTTARAHELRKTDNGWPGLRIGDSGCEERAR